MRIIFVLGLVIWLRHVNAIAEPLTHRQRHVLGIVCTSEQEEQSQTETNAVDIPRTDDPSVVIDSAQITSPTLQYQPKAHEIRKIAE